MTSPRPRRVDCVFCKIIDRTAEALVIYEDEHVMSFVALRPAVPGHTLVVPKAHHADIYSLPDAELARLVSSCKVHALRWRAQVGATGMNMLNANGVDAEQSVFHFHIHLFPRFADDGLRTWPALREADSPRDEMHARFRLC